MEPTAVQVERIVDEIGVGLEIKDAARVDADLAVGSRFFLVLPVNRGILATVYADIKDGVTFEEIRKAYEDYYKDEFFVRLLDDGKCADIHNVRYSNFCDISIHHDKRAGKLVACAAIDNMVKGAAGQAVQNMNIIFGLDEKTGLVLVPPAF